MEDPEVSRLINVRDFLQTFEGISKEISKGDGSYEKQDEYVKNSMGISDAMLEELHSVVGKETLTCEGEPSEIASLLKNVPDNTPLVTLAVQKDTLEKRMRYVPIRREIRYKNNESPYKHALLTATQPSDLVEASLVKDPEVLLALKIYRPFHPKKGKMMLSQQELHVLGSQVLTDLRDVIVCPADQAWVGEFSETPDLPTEICAKDLYKSGFFYIEGVFYNDMRDPNARDYSKTIMDWAEDSNRGIGPFASFVMETVTFMDLNIRLGQPYVYVHQGNCEHCFVFTDVRIMHKDECHDRSQFPLSVYEMRKYKSKCRACLLNNAKWVTTQSNRSPEDPCFFCETCFKAFHYDTHGNKLGSFKAFPVV